MNQEHFCCWQDDATHDLKACMYIVVPQQKWILYTKWMKQTYF